MYGYSLERLERHADALEVYSAVVRRWPRDQEALWLEARCLDTLERYERAIDLLLASEQIGPLSFHAAREFGFAYSKVKDPDRAIAAYETARRMKPYDVDTLDRLQVLYRQRSRHREAYEAVRMILRIDPDHPGARRLLSYVERNRPR